MVTVRKGFPLYADDGKAFGKLSEGQMQGIRSLNQAIERGELHLVENKCLCGCSPSDKDIIVSEKDRYGLSIPQVLCPHCGLIRSGLVFDEKSNSLFYQHFYRDIYSTHSPTDRFFKGQIATGTRFLALLEKTIPMANVERVAEVGCGAGGILVPFARMGKKVDGYDLGEEYLKYGRTKGLSLHFGEFCDLVADESVDLVILSHVLEHFLDPVMELRKIARKLKPGGYILVAVPGVFHIHDDYVVVLDYFQNAHVYNFFKDYLDALFTSLGLEVIYGDEQCTFICRKNPSLEEKPAAWPASADKVADYLLDTSKKYYKLRVLQILRKVRHIAYVVAGFIGYEKIKARFNNRKRF